MEMATKTITVTQDAYDAMARQKREGESFSELFLRLTGRECNISDFLGLWEMDDEDQKVFDQIRRSWLNNTIYYNNRPLNYGTLNSLLWDTDGDNMSDGWEIKYGFDPCDNSSPNKNNDGDQDGISDYNEYCLEDTPGAFVENNVTIKYHNMSKWGAQPDRKDIFVEVDWMVREWFDDYSFTKKELKLNQEMKDKLILLFFKQIEKNYSFTLHIDDGYMGGGTQLDYQPRIYINKKNGGFNDLQDFYLNNFYYILRQGVFHYCVIGNEVFSNGESEDTDWVPGVSTKGHFIIGGEFHTQEKMANVFLHELGHTFGLLREGGSNFTGIDNTDTTRPWKCEFWKYLEYKSVMNYNFIYDFLFNYSDGSNGNDDFDDWDWINNNLSFSLYLKGLGVWD
ncbi:MAG: hypothetical protein MUC62_00485 [Candidatus Thermoplasmatota archaeon]|jgi:predicted CopG family antitoxin|nr:hypothetical protein [Candidatus Thermoplasmatota archaeon]